MQGATAELLALARHASSWRFVVLGIGAPTNESLEEMVRGTLCVRIGSFNSFIFPDSPLYSPPRTQMLGKGGGYDKSSNIW